MSTSELTSMYDHLLEENARSRGNCLNNHFTSRLLVRAIIEVMRPKPGELICDMACRHGNRLAACHDYIMNNFELDKEQLYHLRHKALRGWEQAHSAARLAAMNLHLRLGANLT